MNLFIAAIAVVALLLPTAFPNLSKLSSRLGMIGCVLVAFYAIYGAMVYVEPPTFRNPDGLYYNGKQVAQVELPVGTNKTIEFPRISSTGRIDFDQEMVWGNYILKCKKRPTNSVMAGATTNFWTNVRCHLLGKNPV